MRYPYANVGNAGRTAGQNADNQDTFNMNEIGFIISLWTEARLDQWIPPTPTLVPVACAAARGVGALPSADPCTLSMRRVL
jgi:hypothetical protein